LKHFIFLLILVSALLFSKETTTHIAQLNIKSQEMQTICLKLTSDGQTVITRSDRQIHLWNSKDLNHLGSIKDVTAGYGCDLQKNDRYFLVQDMSRIYLYDLQTLKHIKNFDIPSKRHNDSIMSASFSEDGKYINSFEYTQSKPGQSKPILYRYNIDTKKREKLKSLPSFSGSYNLKGDKLYFFDSIQNKIISNHALDTLLRFDVPVIEQVITKLNKVDDCSKIMYLDLKNSLIAKKVSKEVFERYRCGNE